MNSSKGGRCPAVAQRVVIAAAFVTDAHCGKVWRGQGQGRRGSRTGLWRSLAGRGAGSPGRYPERTGPAAPASGGYTATSAASRSLGFMKVDPSSRLMLEKYSNTCADRVCYMDAGDWSAFSSGAPVRPVVTGVLLTNAGVRNQARRRR